MLKWFVLFDCLIIWWEISSFQVVEGDFNAAEQILMDAAQSMYCNLVNEALPKTKILDWYEF